MIWADSHSEVEALRGPGSDGEVHTSGGSASMTQNLYSFLGCADWGTWCAAGCAVDLPSIPKPEAAAMVAARS